MPSPFRLAAALAVLASTFASPAAQPRVRVLFVGNSLTAANDLPQMVERLAAASGVDIETAAIALPNFGLQEHWDDGRALLAIRKGGWTHVVLQQGPSSLPESRRVLVEYARQFAPAIRAADARIVFYGVWPEQTRRHAFEAVTASYAAAAAATGGTLAPAGATWIDAWRKDPDLPFYGADGFHPSPAGTYAAAVTVTAAIIGKTPRPARLPSVATLSDAQVQLIHQAAAAAIAQHRQK